MKDEAHPLIAALHGPRPWLVAGTSVAILGVAPLAALASTWVYNRLTGAGEAGVVVAGALERHQTLQTVIYFGVLHGTVISLTLLAARRLDGDGVRLLAWLPPRQGAKAYLAAALGLVALAAAWFGFVLSYQPQLLYSEIGSYPRLLRGELGWLMALVLCLIAPLAEELLFRGLLFQALGQSRPGGVGAALVSTLVWVGLHVDKSAGAKAQLFAAGLLLCWLTAKVGSTRVPVVCHVLFNVGVTLALLVFYQPS